MEASGWGYEETYIATGTQGYNILDIVG